MWRSHWSPYVFSCQARQIAANSCRILPPSLQALFAAKREVMRQSTDLPALLKHLARAGAQEIANSLWAFATLEHHTGAQLLDAAAVQIARRIEQFSPQARAPALRPLRMSPGACLLMLLRSWSVRSGLYDATVLRSSPCVAACRVALGVYAQRCP